MAFRPAFYVANGSVNKLNVSFEWVPGLSATQKKKSVANMHAALDGKTLEVSTKSENILGQKLSAFNLKYKGMTLENVFQSSKVFQLGGPYRDLLNVSAREAKRDPRLKESGLLKAFELDGYTWPLNPKTAFYDYIYCKAVKESLSEDEIREIASYEYFTDIEFNPEKSINTQARTAAIIKMMVEKYGMLPDIDSPEEFIRFHMMFVKA